MIDLIESNESLQLNLTYNTDLVFPDNLPILDPLEEPTEEVELAVDSCEESVQPVASPSGYFTIDNLFSELLTAYQRAKARENLGISDSSLLLWGNLSGNLENQTDLVTFVNRMLESKTASIEETVKEIANSIGSDVASTVYYGNSLTNLTKVVSNSFTVTGTTGYIYVLTKYQNTEFEVNGLIGGFTSEGTRTVGSEAFYVYKSVYSDLGQTKITVHYGDN